MIDRSFSRTRRSRRRSAIRRDLQGLRGLGVAFVVIGHLWQQPPGAFAMLDMFFVLSGFWIIPILVEGFREHGPRFAAAFYLNRARRLMPAATLVIIATMLLFAVVYSSARAELVAVDGLWALAFLVNWHFIAVDADYFHDHTPSPLVHYWSLSVEEQFYAVSPFVILAVIVLAGRMRRPAPHAVLVGALVVIGAASFTYSMWHSVAHPMAAYFSTLDRVWEFAIGGLLGLLGPRLASHLSARAAAALGWAGFVGIIVTVFVIPLGVAFPAPYGLFPVLLTGAILVSGIDRDTRYLPVVDNPVMVYLGDISYSLYLWHLPIAVLLTAWFPLGEPAFYVSAIALSFAAAVATFHLVERPLRNAPFLMTKPERVRRARRRRSMRRSKQAGWLALATTGALALCVASLAPRVAPDADLDLPVFEPAAASSPTLLDVQQAAILEALHATSFPELRPGLSDLGFEAWAAAQEDFGCVDVDEEDVDDCRFGSGKRLAVVIGDSFAISWMPGIRLALGDRSWTVQQLTLEQCPAWTLPSYVLVDGTPNDRCAAHHDLVRDYLDGVRPDLVVLASAAANVRNAERDDIDGSPSDVARVGLAATLRDLRAHTSSIVVLGSPPSHQNLVECVSRVGSPRDCVSGVDPLWKAADGGEQAAARAAGVRFVLTRDWFCYWGSCPAFVGRTPVTQDGGHLTLEYSRQLAPLLREALLGTPSTVTP